MRRILRCFGASFTALAIAVVLVSPAAAAGGKVAVFPSKMPATGPGFTWVATDHGLFRQLVVAPYKGYVWNGQTPNVQQAWNYTCVAASIQSELAMALGSFDTSTSKQWAIYTWGRAHMGFPLPDDNRGLDPYAWASALNYFSGGKVSYRDATWDDGQQGLRDIALTMRRTGHPQGIVVYAGLHAWTIIGFTANADPAVNPRFTVTGVYVMAPFIRWTDPPAGTYYKAGQFIDLWGLYYERSGTTQWTGKYTAIIGG
jgi:hypothetical protein